MNKNRTLWIIFILLILLGIVNFIFEALKMEVLFIRLSVYLFSIILLILHIVWSFGVKKGLFFGVTSFSIGLLFEIVGVHTGAIFGGFYTYTTGELGPMFWGVPIFVPVFWSFFIYTGYTLTSSFLIWIGSEKPSRKNNKIASLIPLILLDILIVVSIDMIMDPIMVEKGYWFWRDGGSYFDVPIGNFIGWGMVVLLSSILIRGYDFLSTESKNQLTNDALLMPSIGYIGLFLIFFMETLRLGLASVGLLSIFILLPIPLLNIILYIHKNRM